MKTKTWLIMCIFAFTLSLQSFAQYVICNFGGFIGDGIYPYGNLTLSADTLYGMTGGGGGGVGTMFSLQTNGNGYKQLSIFCCSFGSHPFGSLILSGDTLYGMTSGGGVNNDGVIFSIQTNGNNYTVLHSFNDTLGGVPWGSLILSGDTLYGMTSQGGVNNDGVIFSIQTNGSNYIVLHNFNDTLGWGPYGSLILSGDTLYGMTSHGGDSNYGVIFSMQTNGNMFTDLHDFNGTLGKYPYGDLTLFGDTLYGMTNLGGANGKGIIFSIQNNGSHFTDLQDFSFLTKGSQPEGSLTRNGTTLYGMAQSGGYWGYGVIFSIQTNGSGYNILTDFDATNGEFPLGSLIYSKGCLYGMAPNGGAHWDGVVFSYCGLPLGLASSSIDETTINVFNNNSGNIVLRISANKEDEYTIKLVNLMGQTLYSETKNLTSGYNEFTITPPSLCSGLYVLNITSHETNYTTKIIELSHN